MTNITSYAGAIDQTNKANFDALINASNSNSDSSDFEELLTGFSDTGSSNNVGGFNFNSVSIDGIGALFGLASPDLFPATLNDRADLESKIGTSGPLPTFLNMISKAEHLTNAQTQSLYDIAANNMDVNNTPEDIKKIGDQLTAAGIQA